MGRCEKQISQEKSHLGKSKIELAAGTYLVEIILTFQTACVTNLDLMFCVGFYHLSKENYL